MNYFALLFFTKSLQFAKYDFNSSGSGIPSPKPPALSWTQFEQLAIPASNSSYSAVVKAPSLIVVFGLLGYIFEQNY